MADEDWGEALRDAYNRWARQNGKPTNNGITFPSGIRAERTGDVVRLTMSPVGQLQDDGTRKPPQVCQNMQTDSAAFESWALALKLWLGEEKITLRWEAPSPEIIQSEGRNTKEGCHYERFLYRAHVFGSMFEWFDVDEESKDLLRTSRAIHASTLSLNLATKERETKAAQEPLIELSEDGLERHLAQSTRFRDAMQLSQHARRQFPVGLFSQAPPTKQNRIFSGGKSAIDLIGIDKNGALCVFELKRGGGKNDKAGILSELLLYVALLREVADGDGRISFWKKHSWNADVEDCRAIRGTMLGFEFHPLLRHPELTNVLDKGAQHAWRGKPVTFTQIAIDPTW